MREISIIIASGDEKKQNDIFMKLKSQPKLNVLAQTRSLMATYNDVERLQPDIVIIDNSFVTQPEFKVMHRLFESIDIRWLAFASKMQYYSQTFDPQPTDADLFTLPYNLEVNQLLQGIYSITKSKRSPIYRETCGEKIGQGYTGKNDGLILIGASTGGVEATITILQHWSMTSPATLLVQHTSSGFGTSLVSLLSKQCSATVSLCTSRTMPRPGNVYVVAGLEHHVAFDHLRRKELAPVSTDAVCGHRPSIDVLFKSAVPFAQEVSAVILTGMGRDGADGLRALRSAGARTIAQDEATSVVYGMPRAAAQIGAADRILPIDKIGPALLAMSSRVQTNG
ncbi:chemotaxis protein CheB [Cognatishimia sp. F0-27]|uniref:chemotaxis protein CheB n=1 Tax=Cognatishimia sp. F0-27 TaxID=2816855 RepID=UPI001D0C5B8F|nr:chemotaxis protein CheB [Cognatishimia sp. F0-27]MCC1492052.1 chemotaxis protein CheB [Cognatishimia sp. F0-27]